MSMAFVPSYCAGDEIKYHIHHIIDMPEEMENPLLRECRIYRVGEPLRKIKPEAYTPQLISIGPMHRHNEALKPMEKEKRRYFNFFRKRLSDKETDTDTSATLHKLWKYYEETLLEQQQLIRGCYSEEYPELTMLEFADMMLLDSIFIMELFLRKSEEYDCNEDYMFTPWLQKGIQLDLVLLENQLPIFVLVKLYNSVVPSRYKIPYRLNPEEHQSFFELACCYFSSFDSKECEPVKKADEPFGLPTYWEQVKQSIQLCTKRAPSSESPTVRKMKNCENSQHFTDLIRHMKLPPRFLKIQMDSETPKKESKKWETAAVGFEAFPDGGSGVLKSATKLDMAGVHFEKVQDKCLLHIKFQKHWMLDWLPFLSCIPLFNCFKARLLFPQLTVDSTTGRVFRNLIALEQHHYPKSAYISSYVCLLDYLVNTKEDVDLLVDKQVIVHRLGCNEDMANLANSLCKNVLMSPECYGRLVYKLNAHYNNKWNRTMATLKSVYFPDLWRSSATVVGLAVLFFTFFNFFRNILRH